MPPKFFITHSWHDIEFAKQFTDAMRGEGLEGFFDAYSLYPGDVVTAEIQKGLEACDVYVPILSDAALKSPWCDEEINAAITLSKLPGRNGRPRIIPVLVEPVQDRMSIFLRARLFVRFENNFQTSFQEFWRGVMVTPTAKMAPPAPTVLLAAKGEWERAGVDHPTLERMQKVKKNQRIFNKAGQEMILIPAGEAEVYNYEGGDSAKWETTFIADFYISRYPVTNSEYKRFVDTKGWSTPTHWVDGEIPVGKESHPVVNVNWSDIMAFCEWAEVSLPSMAKWYKAAHWDQSKRENRRYPWGNSFDIDKCNSKGSQIGDTTPVGKYSPKGDSFYEIGDMAGNVWEWIPTSTRTKILLGCSFVNDRTEFERGIYVIGVNPEIRGHDMGFRVVKPVSLDE